MTEDEAFKILAAEKLAGFGWSIVGEDIPDVASVDAVFGRAAGWWNGLSQDTRDIITELDLADGIWNKGCVTESRPCTPCSPATRSAAWAARSRMLARAPQRSRAGPRLRRPARHRTPRGRPRPRGRVVARSR